MNSELLSASSLRQKALLAWMILRIGKFAAFFPEYKDRKLVGAVASIDIDEGDILLVSFTKASAIPPDFDWLIVSPKQAYSDS